LAHGAEVFDRQILCHLIQLAHGHGLELGNVDRNGSNPVLILNRARVTTSPLWRTVPVASFLSLAAVLASLARGCVLILMVVVSIALPAATVPIAVATALLGSSGCRRVGRG